MIVLVHNWLPRRARYVTGAADATEKTRPRHVDGFLVGHIDNDFSSAPDPCEVRCASWTSSARARAEQPEESPRSLKARDSTRHSHRVRVLQPCIADALPRPLEHGTRHVAALSRTNYVAVDADRDLW